MKTIAGKVNAALERQARSVSGPTQAASNGRPDAAIVEKPTRHNLQTPIEPKQTPTIAVPTCGVTYSNRPISRPLPQKQVAQPAEAVSQPRGADRRSPKASRGTESPRPSYRLAANITTAEAKAAAITPERQADLAEEKQARMAKTLQKDK